MQIFHVLSIYFSSKDNKFLNLLYNIIAQSDVNIIEMFGFLHALTDYAKINVIFKLPYIPIHNMYIYFVCECRLVSETKLPANVILME